MKGMMKNLMGNVMLNKRIKYFVYNVNLCKYLMNYVSIVTRKITFVRHALNRRLRRIRSVRSLKKCLFIIFSRIRI